MIIISYIIKFNTISFAIAKHTLICKIESCLELFIFTLTTDLVLETKRVIKGKF